MHIHKPTPEQLGALLDKATKNQTIEKYRETFLSANKRIIGKDPLRYRSFGPYWWLVKRGFVDGVIFVLGSIWKSGGLPPLITGSKS